MEHKSKQTWREKLLDLRATTKSLGKPDFLLMNNEYGLGKASAFAGNWSRFDKGLVAVELALEMYQSGYDIACFWDNGDGVVSVVRAKLAPLVHNSSSSCWLQHLACVLDCVCLGQTQPSRLDNVQQRAHAARDCGGVSDEPNALWLRDVGPVAKQIST